MKVYIYTTLLIILGCCFSTGVAYSQEENKELKTNSQIASKKDGVMTHDVSFDKEVVEELDSLLRNGVGLKRTKDGARSILTMELDPSSKASLSMFGCIDEGYRASLVGKAKPDPRLGSIKNKRTKMPVEKKVDPASLAIASNFSKENASDPKTSSVSVVPRTSSQLGAELSTPTTSTHKEFKDASNRQFRTMNISLVDNLDRALLKKHSLVLGAFRSQNNADFVKRTFNALGEKVFVVRSTTGVFYALLTGSDNQDDVVKLFDSFSQKYTQGVSRPKRISRYGIPLDDIWILIKD